MTIQDQINNDLKNAISKRDNELRDNLKIIVSELQRQKTKILSDSSTVEILKRLIKWEQEKLEKIGESKSMYLDTILRYIPKQLTDEVIEEWIRENIDFSKFRNKFEAIKIILNNFGTSTDGKQVKTILMRM